MLGLPTGIVPSNALVSQADVDAVAATDAGLRAFALLQVGQPARAADELRALWPAVQDNPALRRALLLVAAGAGLTDCAAQFAAWSEALDPGAGEELQFALPALHPAGGFRVDPALVYALTRVESNFEADAVSSAGARGLMQLMPVTAQYVGGDASLLDTSLHDPAVNLELGQRYVIMLAAQNSIAGNLLRLLASYNAGPGGFLSWAATMRDDDDPLLFIEAIPNDETRRFVERALTYTWLYAARLHVPAPSLDDMAAGKFPRFTPLPVGGKSLPRACTDPARHAETGKAVHGADRREPAVHSGEHRRARRCRTRARRRTTPPAMRWPSASSRPGIVSSRGNREGRCRVDRAMPARLDRRA